MSVSTLYLRRCTCRCIVTCGSDGDVRIWESLDDDDPKSVNVGEKAYSVALRVSRRFVYARLYENESENRSDESTASIYKPRSGPNRKGFKIVDDLATLRGIVCVRQMTFLSSKAVDEPPKRIDL